MKCKVYMWPISNKSEIDLFIWFLCILFKRIKHTVTFLVKLNISAWFLSRIFKIIIDNNCWGVWWRFYYSNPFFILIRFGMTINTSPTFTFFHSFLFSTMRWLILSFLSSFKLIPSLLLFFPQSNSLIPI